MHVALMWAAANGSSSVARHEYKFVRNMRAVNGFNSTLPEKKLLYAQDFCADWVGLTNLSCKKLTCL